MKRITTVLALVISAFAFLAIASPAHAATVTAGPAGVNGLRAYPGPDKGSVTLEWSRVTLTGENYSVRYGTSSGNYPWIADHVGYIATYTVKNLTPGVRYYFALERIQVGNVSLGWSGEVSAVAPAFSTLPVVTAGPIGRNLLTAQSVGSGKVKLSWRRYFSDTESWHVVYGTRPGQFQYGILSAVTTTPGVSNYNYTIGALPRGKRMYFALVPVRGGQAVYITAEVSTIVK
jgi:hypothetical protein